MGVTGFVLKDLAAILGPFGYTLKDIQKELLKSKQPTAFIRKARILQGTTIAGSSELLNDRRSISIIINTLNTYLPYLP